MPSFWNRAAASALRFTRTSSMTSGLPFGELPALVVRQEIRDAVVARLFWLRHGTVLVQYSNAVADVVDLPEQAPRETESLDELRRHLAGGVGGGRTQCECLVQVGEQRGFLLGELALADVGHHGDDAPDTAVDRLMGRVCHVNPARATVSVAGLGFVFDGSAGEGGLDVRANPVPGFCAENFLERMSDHLLARQAEPARVLLVAPDIASVGPTYDMSAGKRSLISSSRSSLQTDCLCARRMRSEMSTIEIVTTK